MLHSLLWQCQQRKAVSESEPFDWEEKEGNDLETGMISSTGIQITAEYVAFCSVAGKVKQITDVLMMTNITYGMTA